MKVILLEKYKKLGEVGDLVEVKSGFARNYLIPNEKAIQATKDNISYFEDKKAELVKQSKANEAEAQKAAKTIENRIVTVIKQAGDDGRLYGSVSTGEIAEELNKNVSEEITRKEVTLNTSIKFLGFYQAQIDLGESVVANVYVNVSRTESEAKEVEEKFNKGKISIGALSKQAEREEKYEIDNKISEVKAEEVTESGSQESDSKEAEEVA